MHTRETISPPSISQEEVNKEMTPVVSWY